jgi:prepilin-type N-terminal cleavage/methylation domain-containing protein/prepilin-type processing-associated H-X9-DG protein
LGHAQRGAPTVRGLTLVELLVVIVIIAVLAGLIMAALWASSSKGRQATCMSNLRQIAQAVRLYAEDYDGVPPRRTTSTGRYVTPADPPRADGVGPDPRPKETIDALARYGAPPAIWFCPSDPDRGKYVVRDMVQHWLTSYRYVGWYEGVGGDVDPSGHVLPPDILSVNDSAARLYYMVACDARYYRQLWPGIRDAPLLSSWHSGGFNVAFIDGTVKWMPVRRDISDEIPSPFLKPDEH